MNIIPNSWELTPLTSLYYLPTGVQAYDGQKPYYSTGSIKSDVFTSEGEFNYLSRPSRANRISAIGDIFQARMKATNKVLLIDNNLADSLFSTGFFQLRPSASTLDSKYLLHYFSSFKFLSDKDNNCTGATQQSLNDTNAKKILIPIAPLNEQKRISKKLDELFATLESIKTRLDNAPTIIKRFQQSILAAATSGKLTEEWREESGIAEEWESVNLDSVIHGKPKNGYSPQGVSYETPVKNLTLTATTSGKFIEGYFKYVDIEIPHDSNLWLNSGDILIQRGNTIDYVGISAIYDGESGKYIYPDLMMKIISNNKMIENKFLHYVLLSNATRQYFKDNATGTSGNMPKINQKVVMNTPIKLPTLEEQKEIVSQVESLFALADTLEEKIEAAKKRVDRLTQSILAKAFKGELVPQDPNDEPAEKLLKRIKVEQEKEKSKKKVNPKKANKPKKTLTDCTTAEKLSALLIKEFAKQEFTIEDVYSTTQCDKEKLIKFIFQLVKDQKFEVNQDSYEIYNLWKNDKQVLKINRVL